MEKEKYKSLKNILDKYKKGKYNDYKSYDYKSYDWCEIKIKEGLTSEEILDIIKNFAKSNDGIFMILESLPEDAIQNFLRAKKLNKIKGKSNAK